MKKIYGLFLIFIFVIVCFSLVGCDKQDNVEFGVINNEMEVQEKSIEQVEKNVPNAKFLGTDNMGDELKVFNFTNGDFNFEFEYKFVEEPISFHSHQDNKVKVIKTNYIFNNNYIKKLYEYKKDEILKLSKKNNIVLIDDFSKMVEDNSSDYEEPVVLYVNFDDNLFFGQTNLYFYVSNDMYFDNVYYFFNDMKELLIDYVPERYEIYSGNMIFYSIFTTDSFYEFFSNFNFVKSDMIFDIEESIKNAKTNGSYIKLDLYNKGDDIIEK